MFSVLFQLQHLVVDDICVQSMDLFTAERKHSATGGYVATMHQRFGGETTYQRKAEQLMSDENCFKIMIVSLLLFVLKKLLAFYNRQSISKGFSFE